MVRGNEHFINFGRNVPAGVETYGPQVGYECGRISLSEFSADHFGSSVDGSTGNQDLANIANATQMGIVHTFARTIQMIGDQIATGHLSGIGADPDFVIYADEYTIIKNASISYVNAMYSNQSVFVAPDATAVDGIDLMRGQGWITAGNYYQVLAGLQANYILEVAEHTPAVSGSRESGTYEAEVAALYANFTAYTAVGARCFFYNALTFVSGDGGY